MRLSSVRITLIICFCLSLMSMLSGIAPAQAYAATNAITVTSRSQTVDFPKSLDFFITASSTSGNITQATINIAYVLGGIYGGSQSENHNVPVSQVGHTVTLHDHEDLTGGAFVTPGTPVVYNWTLQDSAGHSYTDATQNFTITDTRFQWQHLSQGMVQVYWYNQPKSFGQLILARASESLARITASMGATPTTPLKLWIYATHEDFFGAIEPNSYEWVGGIAYPHLSQAFFVITDPNAVALVRDMPHEMTHLVFAQLENHALTVPSWFNEGLAVYNQAYHEDAMDASFQQALATHTLLPLDQISGDFPSNGDQAYLAYAEGWKLVDYMYRTFGRAKMASFLQALNSPLIDFDGAAKQTLGVDSAHLEAQWRASLGQSQTHRGPSSANSTPALAQTANMLVLISGLLVGAMLLGVLLVLVTMSRRKRRLATVAEQSETPSLPVDTPTEHEQTNRL